MLESRALALPITKLCHRPGSRRAIAEKLAYLHRDARRTDRRAQPAATGTIVLTVALSYHFPFDEEQTNTKIARPWHRLYHFCSKARLQDLIVSPGVRFSDPLLARVCVDTAPLLERSWQRNQGLVLSAKTRC